MTTVCFTGHRPKDFDGWNAPAPQHVLDWLETYINKLVDMKDKITFISGAAQGVDQWAADIVLKVKKERPEKEILLTIAMPYVGFGNNWPHAAREKLDKINKYADNVVYVLPKECTRDHWFFLQKRNEWMVDRSELVLAVWNGSTGGTFNCVQYAKQQKIRIIRYDFPNRKTYKIG